HSVECGWYVCDDFVSWEVNAARVYCNGQVPSGRQGYGECGGGSRSRIQEICFDYMSSGLCLRNVEGESECPVLSVEVVSEEHVVEGDPERSWIAVSGYLRDET